MCQTCDGDTWDTGFKAPFPTDQRTTPPVPVSLIKRTIATV
jgi:hypothetical protein